MPGLGEPVAIYLQPYPSASIKFWSSGTIDRIEGSDIYICVPGQVTLLKARKEMLTRHSVAPGWRLLCIGGPSIAP